MQLNSHNWWKTFPKSLTDDSFRYFATIRKFSWSWQSSLATLHSKLPPNMTQSAATPPFKLILNLRSNRKQLKDVYWINREGEKKGSGNVRSLLFAERIKLSLTSARWMPLKDIVKLPVFHCISTHLEALIRLTGFTLWFKMGQQ